MYYFVQDLAYEVFEDIRLHAEFCFFSGHIVLRSIESRS